MAHCSIDLYPKTMRRRSESNAPVVTSSEQDIMIQEQEAASSDGNNILVLTYAIHLAKIALLRCGVSSSGKSLTTSMTLQVCSVHPLHHCSGKDMFFVFLSPEACYVQSHCIPWIQEGANRYLPYWGGHRPQLSLAGHKGE
jgi:hypothetical protein